MNEIREIVAEVIEGRVPAERKADFGPIINTVRDHPVLVGGAVGAAIGISIVAEDRHAGLGTILATAAMGAVACCIVSAFIPE